jgi:hypothetical protein
MACAYTQMNQWLTELNSIHRATMGLNAEGYCCMMSESGVEITLLAERGAIHFRVVIDIIPVPHYDQAQFFQKCLSLNFDQGLTGGASIAADTQTHAIVLSYIREVERTTFTEFNNLLQNLLTTASRFKTELIEEAQKHSPIITSAQNVAFMV